MTNNALQTVDRILGKYCIEAFPSWSSLKCDKLKSVVSGMMRIFKRIK